jgi:NadR type nicotinamide-nucleotide adenylyltransferase
LNNVIKIAIVGPESTGKSKLSEELAKHFNTIWVPEYSREYLRKIGLNYSLQDIININKGQLKLENDLTFKANTILFCDTTPLVNKIWCEYKYQQCPLEIEESFKNTFYNYHFLCDIDLPWEEDPLREHPNKRKELFDSFEQTLIKYQKPYSIIKGMGYKRIESALDSFLRNKYIIFKQ